jgi:membrane associated rhomboid family serine protease
MVFSRVGERFAMFFLLPVGVDYQARRYPVITFTLMGICIVVYLVTLMVGLSTKLEVDDWALANLWLIPAESHWWAYITNLFVHAGFWHLAGNMVYLFLFGSCVEDIIGRTRFVVFYLICGLAADFAHIAVIADHFNSEIALGGASGAISGCIGGFLILLHRTRIEFKWVFFFWFRIWSGEFFLPAWVVISFWFLEDFAGLVMSTVGGRGGVAFGAHVGGTLVGMGLIALEKMRRKKYPEPEDEPEDEPELVAAATPARVAARPAVRVRARARPVAAAAAVAVADVPTIYLTITDAQSGPYTAAQIQQMFAAGSIPSDAFYWQEGMETWGPVEDLRSPGGG